MVRLTLHTTTARLQADDVHLGGGRTFQLVALKISVVLEEKGLRHKVTTAEGRAHTGRCDVVIRQRLVHILVDGVAGRLGCAIHVGAQVVEKMILAQGCRYRSALLLRLLELLDNLIALLQCCVLLLQECNRGMRCFIILL